MDCTHTRGFPRHRYFVSLVGVAGFERALTRLECLTCGEWLPLGPATITPEVEIEINIAQAAALCWAFSLGDKYQRIWTSEKSARSE